MMYAVYCGIRNFNLVQHFKFRQSENRSSTHSALVRFSRSSNVKIEANLTLCMCVRASYFLPFCFWFY